MSHKKKAAEKKFSRQPSDHDTLNKENLVCPLCGFENEPEDFQLGKRRSGTLKCGDCGEHFDFEAFRKTTFTTYIP